MSYIRMIACASLGVALLTMPGALAGPDWAEQPPGAGSLPGTAQDVLVSPVKTISGELSGSSLRGLDDPDFEDMYRIYINDPLNFSARTDGADPDGLSDSDFNSQLFLFDANGRGLLGNVMTPFSLAPNQDGSFIAAPSDDSATPAIPGPGFYFIAISGFFNQPLADGDPIFDFPSLTTISGPTGPGGPGVIDGWIGEGEIGSYTIYLTGVIPTPGTLAALGIGLAVASRRRRA
ncbi:MAG: hypothetical protein EA376_06075 [Phycisphaeraceae bacterium]|nr:MAG: hypothetical protein EA376_06075 [Phycisphaeraceae bacterium]